MIFYFSIAVIHHSGIIFKKLSLIPIHFLAAQQLFGRLNGLL